MNQNMHAVLIGLDTYQDTRLTPLSFAEKDAHDIRNVLTDPKIGKFPAHNITLLTGQNVTTRRVEEELYLRCVKDRTPNDIVVVYFSGHGFIAGRSPQGYLGTYDVSLPQLLENPNAGLRLAYIHDEIFVNSPARCIVLILDCCHSGAFIPQAIRGFSEHEAGELIDARTFSRGMGYGRVALVACQHDKVSRESEFLRNGIFTYYLLNGLRGAAAEVETGEVTVDSLSGYVRNSTPAEQMPGRYGQDFGRVVLTSPGGDYGAIKMHNDERQQFSPARLEAQIGSEEFTEIIHLEPPLLPYLDLTRRMIDHLEANRFAHNMEAESPVLESIRAASDAEFVFVMKKAGQHWQTTAYSALAASGQSRDFYLEKAILKSVPAIREDHPATQAFHCVSRRYQNFAGEQKVMIVIAMGTGASAEMMVVCGLPSDTPLLKITYALVLTTFYQGCCRSKQIDFVMVEGAILDELKKVHKFVPQAMYDRRFDLFNRRLNRMTVHFQPILHLHPYNPTINSWEALARDPHTLSAPFDLFDAVEWWGLRFKLELDMHFLRVATDCYSRSLQKTSNGLNNIVDLSINVYTDSLMTTPYFEAMREVIRHHVIPSEKIVLEISEKTPIPSRVGDHNIVSSFEMFRRRLEDYVRNFQIGFAIDDFGVGHSSTTRLCRLKPGYVKIDRDVLLQDLGNNTISYVLDLAKTDSVRATKVVVEGFDDDSRIPLHELYNLGVKFVQGFKIARPEPEVKDLKPKHKRYLSQLIAGQQRTDNRYLA